MSADRWFTMTWRLDVEAPDLETARRDFEIAHEAVIEALPADRAWWVEGGRDPTEVPEDAA